QKLSVAALETLAVVAYKQPVTGPEVAEIRGVNAVGVIGTLIERKLVKIVGRKQVVGRPFLYGTTREFLERFGLNDLSDLPRVEVNGKVVSELGTKADPSKDEIKVDGRRLPRTAPEHRYLLLYKPRQVISTRVDPQRRTTVIDLLANAGVKGYFYPVGRLDY